MTVHLSTLSSTGDRGTPTGLGAQYTDWVTWSAAAQTNHSAGDQSILECYNGTTVVGNWVEGGVLRVPSAQDLDLSGWNNDDLSSAEDIIIRPADGEVAPKRPFSTISSGFRVELVGGNQSRAITFDSYGTVKDLHFTCNGLQQMNEFVRSWDPADVVMDSCWTEVITGTGGSGLCRAFTIPSGNVAGGEALVTNCVFYKMRNTQYPTSNAHATVSNGVTSLIRPLVANCTYYGCRGTADRCDVQNCVSTDSTGSVDFYAANEMTQIGNNASGDSTATGTGSVTGVDASLIYTDEAAGDFSVVAGQALDGSINPAADLSNTFTNDITGATRTLPWEIGAFDIISAGGVTFDGPDIVDQTGTLNQPFSFDDNGEGTVASRFSVS